jgi:hypothetical protein
VCLVEVGGVVLFLYFCQFMLCGWRGIGGKDVHLDTNSDLRKELNPQKDPASLPPPPHSSAPEPQLHSPPQVSLPPQEVLQVEWEARRLSWCLESRLGVSL